MNILSRIRGEDIAAASATLPCCEAARDEFLEAAFDVPKLDDVLFLFKRFRHKHGKSVIWFWAAQAAVLKRDVVGED